MLQVAEGDMELHKLRKASEQLKREKEALQNDALQLTERTMELEHANRMLTNEVNEKKAGRAKSMRDSWSLDGGGLPTSPAPNVPIPGEGVQLSYSLSSALLSSHTLHTSAECILHCSLSLSAPRGAARMTQKASAARTTTATADSHFL